MDKICHNIYNNLIERLKKAKFNRDLTALVKLVDEDVPNPKDDYYILIRPHFESNDTWMITYDESGLLIEFEGRNYFHLNIKDPKTDVEVVIEEIANQIIYTNKALEDLHTYRKRIYDVIRKMK